MDCIKLTCGNPDCGKDFSFPAPVNPGAYHVACPFCKIQNAFKFPIEVKPETPPFTPDDSVKDSSSNTHTPPPQHKNLNNNISQKAPKEQNSQKEQPSNSYPQKKLGLQTDGSFRLNCSNPRCCQALHVKADIIHQGTNTIACPKCGAKQSFIVGSKVNNLNQSNGKATKFQETGFNPPANAQTNYLKLVTGLFPHRKTYTLVDGSHYIGRSDHTKPSNFSVEDRYASRRSLKIDVVRDSRADAQGLNHVSYKLSVINAANPVFINNRRIFIGDTVMLRPGDIITIGRTRIQVMK